MTLRMGDGPVANLPPGLDAYAGYVDEGGLGVTYPGVVARFPSNLYGRPKHLSISVHGHPAQVGDVEKGALSSWSGYTVGYCAVSNVNALVAQFGRPPLLWTAHYDEAIGPHICSPVCWPGLVTTADGTQWTNHGKSWDESLLRDGFFDLLDPPTPGPSPIPTLQGGNMETTDPGTGGTWTVHQGTGAIECTGGAPYLGNLIGNRFGWQSVGVIAGIAARKDGAGQWGYDVAILRPAPGPDGAWFAHYTFPRDGSQANH